MRASTREPGSAGGGRWRALAPRLALLLGAAVLAGACGQVGGIHRGGSGLDPVASAPSPPSATLPGGIRENGENSGPKPGTITYTVVVKKVRLTNGTAVSPGDDPLRMCPVQGRGSFSDDFGAPRFAGGYHPHQGNDMFAAMGTPIVAPFDGTAVPAPNTLGGEAVKVFGPLGYVYNAHLSAYGKTGPVRQGDVIGYVGNSGDALGGPPHDHFEWHPANGPAVNPFPFLVAVCT